MEKTVTVRLTLLTLLTQGLFPAWAQADSLHSMCQHGIRAEMYSAQAARFQIEGHQAMADRAESKAAEHGAFLGYPGFGVPSMIKANATAIREGDESIIGLSELEDNALVLSPLLEECLSEPWRYIRGYEG
ncbi:hypothetical protein ACWIJ6_16690 [Aeromonas piscicola]